MLWFFPPPCPLHPRLPPTGTFCPSVQRGTDPGRGGERNCPESKPLIPLRGWTSWVFPLLLLGVVSCSSGKDSGSGHPDMGLNLSQAMPQQTSLPAPVSLGAQGQSAHPGVCHQEEQRPCKHSVPAGGAAPQRTPRSPSHPLLPHSGGLRVLPTVWMWLGRAPEPESHPHPAVELMPNPEPFIHREGL